MGKPDILTVDSILGSEDMVKEFNLTPDIEDTRKLADEVALNLREERHERTYGSPGDAPGIGPRKPKRRI